MQVFNTRWLHLRACVSRLVILRALLQTNPLRSLTSAIEFIPERKGAPIYSPGSSLGLASLSLLFALAYHITSSSSVSEHMADSTPARARDSYLSIGIRERAPCGWTR